MNPEPKLTVELDVDQIEYLGRLVRDDPEQRYDDTDMRLRVGHILFTTLAKAGYVQ